MGRIVELNISNGIRTLLKSWQEAEIRYCHFKSNLHVDAGISGQTDLDILVDKLQYADATLILLRCGFKRFLPKLPSSYFAVEDWIGFNPENGQLFHLHLHWEMTAGEPNLKGYRIPWESEILSSRVFDHDSQIYVSSPETELLLLLTRASLKLRHRDIISHILGKNYPSQESDIQKEFRWLQQRIHYSQLELLGRHLLPDYLLAQLLVVVSRPAIGSSEFLTFARLLKKHFSAHQSYTAVCGHIYRWLRELYGKSSQKLNQKFGLHIIRRRIPSTGGLMLVFVGVDGAGKSTQVKEITRWLGWKVDVCRIYFGSGDGAVSLVRKPLVWLQKLAARKKSTQAKAKQHMSTPAKRGLASKIFQAAWATTLAYEKKQRIQQAVRLRNRGMIVICDRYPQKQIMGFNDGPLLDAWRVSSGILGWLARYEASVFDMIERINPDLVFKLHIDAETAGIRKSDTESNMIQKKIDAVESLHFPRSKVFKIDASQTLPKVSITIKQRIWEHF